MKQTTSKVLTGITMGVIVYGLIANGEYEICDLIWKVGKKGPELNKALTVGFKVAKVLAVPAAITAGVVVGGATTVDFHKNVE